jgi:hypothetical protein
MRVQILHVPDCPNTPVLRSRVEQVLAGRNGVEVDERVVRDQVEAVALGMTGSPTLLVDGVDPFASAGVPASVSCRLYIDESGALSGAPSLAQLRAVFAGEPSTGSVGDGLTLAGWRAADTRSRHAAMPGPLRALQQDERRHFEDSGEPPDLAWIGKRAVARGLDPDAATARLSAADLVHFDESGRVAVAYPFSGTPSGHRVHLAVGVPVWAMCAIDALGIPQMADRDATITATDPSSGDPIRVELRAGAWRWSPSSTAVLIAHTGTRGPSALCTCGHVNFYSTPERARADLAANRQLTGRILDHDDAIELARSIFAGLLPDPDPLRASD